MEKDDYIMALLERIAFQSAPGKLDFDEYLKRTVGKPDAFTTGNEIQGQDNGQGDQSEVGVSREQGDRSKEPEKRGDSHTGRVRSGRKKTWWPS